MPAANHRSAPAEPRTTRPRRAPRTGLYVPETRRQRHAMVGWHSAGPGRRSIPMTAPIWVPHGAGRLRLRMCHGGSTSGRSAGAVSETGCRGGCPRWRLGGVLAGDRVRQARRPHGGRSGPTTVFPYPAYARAVTNSAHRASGRAASRTGQTGRTVARRRSRPGAPKTASATACGALVCSLAQSRNEERKPCSVQRFPNSGLRTWARVVACIALPARVGAGNTSRPDCAGSERPPAALQGPSRFSSPNPFQSAADSTRSHAVRNVGTRDGRTAAVGSPPRRAT